MLTESSVVGKILSLIEHFSRVASAKSQMLRGSLNSLKFSVLFVCATVGASAATIASGTITFGQQSISGSSSSYATLMLSDGVALSGYHLSDGSTTSICRDSSGTCGLLGIPMLFLGDGGDGHIGGLEGLLSFQYPMILPIVLGVQSQTFTVPFTATGNLGINLRSSMPGLVCPFPETSDINNCSVPAQGSGTVFETITKSGDSYFISSATYTFTQTPEPSTVYSAVIGFAAVLSSRVYRRRRRSRQ